MKRLCSLLLALTLLVTAAPALAQSTPALANLQIDLWPEYDKAAVLVIYRGTLAVNVPLPATLSFEIPAGVQPLAVAYKDAQNRLLDLKYTATPNKDTTTLSFSTPEASFHFEYYDTLDTTTPARKFNFKTQIAYPVQNLLLSAQQPRTASNLATLPSVALKAQSDGLSYADYNKNNVNANEAVTFNLTYTKTDATLTNPPTEPVAIATAASSSALPIDQTLLVTIIASLAVLVLIGGGVWYLRHQQLAAAEAAPRRHKEKGQPPRPKEVRSAKAISSVIFCHQCGEPAANDDIFCRKCGTKIRR